MVTVPAGSSSPLTKFWCFFIYNVTFLVLGNFLGVDESILITDLHSQQLVPHQHSNIYTAVRIIEDLLRPGIQSPQTHRCYIS